MINIDLTGVGIAVIQVIFAVILAYMGKMSHSKNKNDKVMELIVLAVGAAEQLYKTGIVNDRKAWVLQKLSENGVDINSPKVDLAIESEVNKLKSVVANLPKELTDGAGIGYDV